MVRSRPHWAEKTGELLAPQLEEAVEYDCCPQAEPTSVLGTADTSDTPQPHHECSLARRPMIARPLWSAAAFHEDHSIRGLEACPDPNQPETIAGARSKKEHTLNDTLSQPNEDQGECPPTPPDIDLRAEDKESFFMSIKEDLHLVKKELLQDLKDIRSEMADLGDGVAALKDREAPRDTEIEQLQQEVLHLK
ncbi:hypothetical protein NDU88_001440 [Pleurodeles waltl]|uniref:Uncharacterized protein n=1 Tax=Pleurodeles waltl TaxID=8319 RepID=A0AAV7WKW1_PLEWA|nr:hypothetical protein NDU88_001440 [Pleurodeles waltl]